LTAVSVTCGLLGASLARLPCGDPADQGIDRLAVGCRPGQESHRAQGEDIARARTDPQHATLAFDDEVALLGVGGLVRCDDAARALALKVGTPVYALIKATEVMVIRG